MTIKSRRLLLAASLGVAISWCCAGAMAQEKRFDGVTLRVATYGGLWRDIMDKEITPKFVALGGKIEYVTGSPQANFAKLVAGRGRAPFDVMEVLDAQVGDFNEADFLAPIDLAKIPNKQFLKPFQYSPKLVAAWFTQEAICYNTEKYKELGLPAPKTYKDLANPALAGKVIIPDITSGGGLAAIGGFAAAAGGSEADIKPGLELINSLKTQKFWSQGDQVVLGFKSGDIYAAAVHAGWCLRAKKVGAPVMSVHPQIKPGVVGVAKDGWLGIMKSSSNVEAAHWFINEYLDAGYQLTFAVSGGVVPVNQKAIDKMGEDPVFAEMLQLKAADIEKELRIDYTKANLSEWNDLWGRTVARR